MKRSEGRAVVAVLDDHAVVEASCVAGASDTAQRERVTAFVVPPLRAAAGDALAVELIVHCRGRLGEFCDRLPLTRFGKVDYRALVERATGERRGVRDG